MLSLVDEHGRAIRGFLTLADIFSLNLKADVVVLSACQTALGKEVWGEGLVGLSLGFMYAGSKSVVATLWSVDDLGTAELMKEFYRNMLSKGLPPPESLRAAQNAIRKHNQWSAPYFWAGFVFQGDWK